MKIKLIIVTFLLLTTSFLSQEKNAEKPEETVKIEKTGKVSNKGKLFVYWGLNRAN